jgi:hypothetical protein
VQLIGDTNTDKQDYSPDYGSTLLHSRTMRDDILPDPNLPNAVRLWAALQQSGGGTWGGCVYDVDKLIRMIQQPK